MNSEEEVPQFADDFKRMVRIVVWNSLGFFFLDFLVPIFANESLEVSGTVVGFLMSVRTIGILLSSTFAGFIVDRASSKKRFVVLGGIGRGISYFVLFTSLVSKSLAGLMTGMFILGFSAGLFWIPFNTLVAQKSHKNNRAYAYGRKDLAVGFGLFIGGILGFTLYGLSLAYSIENVFFTYGSILVFGVSNFAAAFAFHQSIDETKRVDVEEIIVEDENSENLVESRAEVVPSVTGALEEGEGKEDGAGGSFLGINIASLTSENREETGSNTDKMRMLMIGIAFLLAVVLFSAINDTLVKPFLNIYVLENINDQELYAMAAYIPAGVTSMLLAPRMGKVVDRIHPAIGVTITSILGALITWILIHTSSIIGFSLLLLIDTTIAKVAALVVQNIVSRVSRKNRGKMMGANMVFQNLGFVVGPIIGGVLWDNVGQTMPFIMSIFVELSLIPMYWAAVKYVKGNLEENL